MFVITILQLIWLVMFFPLSFEIFFVNNLLNN
jgi:hypothetical protein